MFFWKESAVFEKDEQRDDPGGIGGENGGEPTDHLQVGIGDGVS